MGARTVAEDNLQNFRFRVGEISESPVVGFDPLAGFTTVTTPEITIEMSEHRTGSRLTTHKFPGPVTYGDGTLTSGVVRGDTVLYDWLQAYRTKGVFRTNLVIKLFDQGSDQHGDGTSPEDVEVRSEEWYECFPTNVKVMGDLDASAADVNVQEITVAVEEIKLVDAFATTPTAGVVLGRL